MLRIITANLNGIRSASRKGFFEWLSSQQADFICLQELKAQQADLTPQMLQPEHYQGYFHYAEKKGYSGVGIYSKHPPKAVISGFGIAEFDAEGRYVELQFENLSLISVYVPSGSSSDDRQQAKYRFMAVFAEHLQQLKAKQIPIIVCGDWNIAHQAQDLKNWKSNQKNSGFLPEERAWLSTLFEQHAWLDVYRHVEPNTTQECYTWWSNRGKAWDNNVGWRIDYQIATPDIGKTATQTSIFKQQRFSDHSPLIIDYDYTLLP